jgi:pimeloyl-ACP methyl ester carboxylesterase
MQRAFADLPDFHGLFRQVHYRHGGAGRIPLLMLHASPGASKQLVPLAEVLSAGRHVLAPDRPGAGDSPALAGSAPAIIDYAHDALAFLDALGIAQADIYGAHTGACIAAELAILAPGRVRRVVLDGISLFPPEQAATYLAHYAPPRLPDLAGTHLPFVFQFCRDQSLFFPWFAPTQENARGLGLPSAEALHDLVVEVLKCLPTYHQGYHAAFRFDAPARLPLVTQPVLATCAEDDPLRTHLEHAASLLPHATKTLAGSLRGPGGTASRAQAIAAFLDTGGAAA